jgi:hypothetical protein
MRNWKLLSLSTVVAVAVTAAPAPAGGTDGPPLGDRIKAIQDKLDEMNLKVLPNAFKAIGKDMKALSDDVKRLKENDSFNGTKLRDLEIKMSTMEKQLTQLSGEVQALRDKLPSATVAQYPPVDKATVDEIKSRLRQLQEAIDRLQATTVQKAYAAPETGRVALINLHGEELLFVVNNRSYRLAPGASMTVDLPAGSFTYEVISPSYGLMRRNTPVLRAGETLNISAR